VLLTVEQRLTRGWSYDGAGHPIVARVPQHYSTKQLRAKPLTALRQILVAYDDNARANSPSNSVEGPPGSRTTQDSTIDETESGGSTSGIGKAPDALSQAELIKEIRARVIF